jgi:hypothetical protein
LLGGRLNPAFSLGMDKINKSDKILLDVDRVVQEEVAALPRAA